MNLEDLLQQFPEKRIKPFNGMAINAAIWDESHEYHRRSQGLHAVFSHGAGILTGLEVIASDPTDTAVYILPGIAVDQLGQIIILPQPVAYDIGHEMDGPFHLVLSYGESSPRTGGDTQLEGAPTYVHREFSIFAQGTLANTTGVELARIQRSSRESVLRNASDPLFPGADEIDLRFRREVGAAPLVKVAVIYLGNVSNRRHGRGATYLAQAINRLGKLTVAVEDNVEIGPGVVANSLIYVVGQGEFELPESAVNGLHNYVKHGKGTLLLESVDKQAEASFLKILAAKGIKPEPMTYGSRLMTRPNFFTMTPPGYATAESPAVKMADGIIMSGGNYGLLWQGERQSGLAAREEIRTAVEWGENIVTYAAERSRFGI